MPGAGGGVRMRGSAQGTPAHGTSIACALSEEVVEAFMAEGVTTLSYEVISKVNKSISEGESISSSEVPPAEP